MQQVLKAPEDSFLSCWQMIVVLASCIWSYWIFHCPQNISLPFTQPVLKPCLNFCHFPPPHYIYFMQHTFKKPFGLAFYNYGIINVFLSLLIIFTCWNWFNMLWAATGEYALISCQLGALTHQTQKSSKSFKSPKHSVSDLNDLGGHSSFHKWLNANPVWTARMCITVGLEMIQVPGIFC